MHHVSRINFDELKARADFRRVLSHYNLVPVGDGEQVKIRCPFHDDERPSCSVNLEKKLFHCFACDLSGNVLDFVHRLEAIHATDGQTITLRQAGLRLAEICGVTRHVTATRNGARTRTDGAPFPAGSGAPSTSSHKSPETRQEPATASTAVETACSPSQSHNGAPECSTAARAASGSKTQSVRNKPLNKPLGFQLSLDPEHPYLAERGLSPETIELFGLGFFAGEKGSMVGRVCIPIHNASGELVAYAGRWVGADEDLPAGEEKYKLPAGFHKRLELFNLHRVKRCKHVVIVEGFFGAIHLHCLRIPSVALMGTSLSDEQVALLRDCPALRFVTVMLDGDAAGRAAGQDVAASLAAHWWARIVTLPIGTQPDTVESSALLTMLGKAPAQG